MLAKTTAKVLNNRYELLDVIGAGGMGIVYRARDRLSNSLLALKSVTVAPADMALMHSISNTDNPLLALANEFRLLAGLRHPHIIRVLDYGFDAQRKPYFTMSYLQNAQTLLAAANGLSVYGKVQLLQPVLSALTYMHRRGILHRDLKPANVLVTPNVGVQVLDFGLSTTPDHARSQSGTLWYMAPEILRGQGASVQSDLYSLGVLLYELLVGQRPFEEESITKLIDSILQMPTDLAPLEPLQSVLPGLLDFVGRLLSKNPADRYDSAYAAQQALCAALDMPLRQEDDEIRESYLQAATLIGRGAELNTLTQALAGLRVYADQTVGLWLVAGESGIGKSRLLDELRIRALINGVRVLRGQATSEIGAPYSLLRPALRHLLLAADQHNTLRDEEAAILQSVVPDVAQLLGRALPIIQTENDNSVALTDVIVDLFRGITQPTLLLLDDLQWADESLALVQRLARLQGVPLLIVGAYRDDEAPRLHEQFDAFSSLMHLQRLQPAQISELSQSILGSAPPQVTDLLAQESEGNVFFIIEALRTLAVSAGTLDTIGQRTLPRHIISRGMLAFAQRRLEKLPADYQALLRMAAVLGRQLNFKLLQPVNANDANPIDIDQWLQDCAERAIFSVEGETWRFAHDKLREGILHYLDAAQRQRLHARAADLIAEVYGDDPDWLMPRLYHSQQSGDIQRELDLLPTLINATGKGYNLRQAEQYLLALETRLGAAPTRHSDPRTQDFCNLYKALSQVKLRTGQTKDTLLYTLKIFDLLSPDDADYYFVMIKIADAYIINGYYDEALRYLQDNLAQQEALRGSSNAPDDLEQKILLSKLSYCRYYYRRGQHEQAVTLAQQLLGQAQASADPRPQWLALSYLSSCLYYLKRYDEAEYYTLQQLQIAQQANNSYASIEVRNTLGLIYVAKGQLDVAFDYYQQSIDMAEKLHALHHLRSVTANLAMLYIQQKRYDEGLALYLRSIEATQRTDDMYGLAMRYGALCQIYAELARWPEAKQMLSQWYAAAEADNNFKVHLHGLYALVDVLINADRHTDAAYWFGVLCANALPMHQDQAEQDQREGPIRAALGDAAADTHIQRGKDADFDTAMQVLRDVLNAL